MANRTRNYTKKEFVSLIENNGYVKECKKNAGNHGKWINPMTQEEIVLVLNRGPNKMWCKRMIKEHELKEVRR